MNPIPCHRSPLKTFSTNPYLKIIAMNHFPRPIKLISLVYLFLPETSVLYYSIQHSPNLRKILPIQHNKNIH